MKYIKSILICTVFSILLLENITLTVSACNQLSEEVTDCNEYIENSGLYDDIMHEEFLPNEIEDTNNIDESIQSTEVKDIDLGDYYCEMYVGETQLINVTLFPLNSKVQPVFISLDETVAIINALGRITAISEGETLIEVHAGEIVRSFRLNVINKEKISDFEIENMKEVIAVGETIRIYVDVYPTVQYNYLVNYETSDTNIIKISPNGTVTGINNGTAKIKISIEDIMKEVEITVITNTTEIKIDESFLSLQPDETYRINAIVLPKEAPSKLSFRSLNEKVATISQDGLIIANKIGETTIVVTNGYLYEYVPVLVSPVKQILNEETAKDISEDTTKDHVIDAINEAKTLYEIGEIEFLNSTIIRNVYESGISTIFACNNYDVIIVPEYINNFDSNMKLNINLNHIDEGYTFSIEGNLPGKIFLDFTKTTYDKKYLYLYDDMEDIYNMIQVDDFDYVEISTNGKYLITNKKINKINFDINLYFSYIIIAIVIIIFILIYKNRHIFW